MDKYQKVGKEIGFLFYYFIFFFIFFIILYFFLIFFFIFSTKNSVFDLGYVVIYSIAAICYTLSGYFIRYVSDHRPETELVVLEEQNNKENKPNPYDNEDL